MKELQKQLDMLIRKSGADMQVIEMIRNEPSVFRSAQKENSWHICLLVVSLPMKSI